MPIAVLCRLADATAVPTLTEKIATAARRSASSTRAASSAMGRSSTMPNPSPRQTNRAIAAA